MSVLLKLQVRFVLVDLYLCFLFFCTKPFRMDWVGTLSKLVEFAGFVSVDCEILWHILSPRS